MEVTIFSKWLPSSQSLFSFITYAKKNLEIEIQDFFSKLKLINFVYYLLHVFPQEFALLLQPQITTSKKSIELAPAYCVSEVNNIYQF